LVIPDGECVVVDGTFGIIAGDDGHICAVEHPGGDGDGLPAKSAANDLFFVMRRGRVRVGYGTFHDLSFSLCPRWKVGFPPGALLFCGQLVQDLELNIHQKLDLSQQSAVHCSQGFRRNLYEIHN